MNQDCIVSSIHLREKNIKDYCSTTYQSDIYLQHIPIRLSDVDDIPYPDNIFVLQSALEGYGKLFQFSGYFKVHESQVCIDIEGYVRIWLNSDLSKDYPAN